MVPLRLDVCEDRPRWVEARVRPPLVLQDVSQERTPRRSVKRSSLRRLETGLLASALAAVLLFFVVNFALSLFGAVQQSYAPSALPAQMIIAKTVKPGDTLTLFARRYGNPNAYILDTEEQIARLNHLSGTTPLVPGQHLLIPVGNRTIIAQILQYRHRALVASR